MNYKLMTIRSINAYREHYLWSEKTKIIFYFFSSRFFNNKQKEVFFTFFVKNFCRTSNCMLFVICYVRLTSHNNIPFIFFFPCLKSSASSRGKSQTLPLIKPKNKCTRHLYKQGDLKSDRWILQVLPSNIFWIRTYSTSPSTNEKTSLVTMYPNFCPLFLYVFNNSIF